MIVATNRDLAEQVRKGLFREDLYYRVNVVRMELPPLRRRKEDIPLLVRHFIEKYHMAFRKQVYDLGNQALAAFMGYSFPGNVRELKNIIERAVALIDSEPLPWLNCRRTSGACSGKMS